MHPIITSEDIEKIKAFLQSGKPLSGFRAYEEYHLGGENVQKLEAEFRVYFNIKYAVAFNSATAALHAACVACGIGTGDEVIVSPYSFVSSASCVNMAGGKPVFVDIEEDIFCIDPIEISKAITPNTRAIIPVHLCGHPADMENIMVLAEFYNLKVIEDCAQAIGATHYGQYVGTIGDCGVFSFNQSKTVCSGEGGMLITNDDELALIARAVRNHGEVSNPSLQVLGYNYRMCEIEAILALEQFKRLDENNNHRILLTDYMTRELSKIDCFIPPVTYENCKHVFYTYALKYLGDDRDWFQEELIKRGVYFGKGYVKPLYLLPYFGGWKGQCPVTERMWERELMVTDIFRPSMTIKDCDLIIKEIKSVLKSKEKISSRA